MNERRDIDLAGAAALSVFAVILGLNQVVIKTTALGYSPVFQAGIRSAGAIIIILGWMRWYNIPLRIPSHVIPWALLSGLLFSFEFLTLFLALDLTEVSRVSIILYSMPIWLALAGHFLLPGERLNALRWGGLVLAMTGVVLALTSRSTAGEARLIGDLLALVATWMWAGIALSVRLTPFREILPEQQLMSQILVSAVLLLAAAPLFGPLVRDPTAFHVAGLMYQIIFVGGFGFLFWLKLMAIYTANGVASFSFLSPVLAVIFAWALLGEAITPQVWVALILVGVGVLVINRR